MATENNLNIPSVCASGNLIKCLFFRTKKLLKRSYLKFALYTITIILVVFRHTATTDHMILLEQLEQLDLLEQLGSTEEPTPANQDDHIKGDAGDKSSFTFTAKFNCKPEDISTVYGKKFAIFAGDLNVCSWEYAGIMSFSRPRKPIYQNLSDKAGWPDVHVKSGTVSIDPVLGQFKFAEGDTKAGIERIHYCPTPHGFVHGLHIKGNYRKPGSWEGIALHHLPCTPIL